MFFFTTTLRRKMLKDFKPKINLVEKRWVGVFPFTFKLRWMNIWCKTLEQERGGLHVVFVEKAILVNTQKVKVDNLIIKLAHCAVMKKNPCYTNFKNVAMHNGLGNTHKTLWVNLPMVISHHGWLPPYIGNNVFLLPKVQGKCNMWRAYGPY